MLLPRRKPKQTLQNIKNWECGHTARSLAAWLNTNPAISTCSAWTLKTKPVKLRLGCVQRIFYRKNFLGFKIRNKLSDNEWVFESKFVLTNWRGSFVWDCWMILKLSNRLNFRNTLPTTWKTLKINSIVISCQKLPVSLFLHFNIRRYEDKEKALHQFWHCGFFYWEGCTRFFNELKIGTELTLNREEDNKFDPYAVAILLRRCQLGFIPAQRTTKSANFSELGHAALFEVRIQPRTPDAHTENQVGVIVYIKPAQ